MYIEIVYRNIYNVSQNLFDLTLSEKALKLKTEELTSKIEDITSMLLIRHYLSQTVSLHKSTKRLQRLTKDLH
jgi:DNA integrity scanning protein DisA with diadenylate cyclase activity